MHAHARGKTEGKREAAEEKEKRKFEHEEKIKKKVLEQTTRKKGAVHIIFRFLSHKRRPFFAELPEID